MTDFSKLTLSDEELELVGNSHWILTKRVIIDKVAELFGILAQEQLTFVNKAAKWLPPETMHSSPKIARGENYLLLPYLILDYPRCFTGDDIFAVRTMFWWGNFFSVTLHLSGRFKSMFEEKVMMNLQHSRQDIFVCVHENQWHHHFKPGNYTAVKAFRDDGLNKQINNMQFLKLAIKFPLQPLEDVKLVLEGAFEDFIELLKS